MTQPPIAVQCRVTLDTEMDARAAARAMANPVQRQGENLTVRLIVPSSRGFLVAELPQAAVEQVLEHVSHFQDAQDRRDFIRQWLADNVQNIRSSYEGQSDAAAFDFNVVPVRQVAIVRRVEDIVPRPTFSREGVMQLQERIVAASRDTAVHSRTRQELALIGRAMGRLIRAGSRLSDEGIRLLTTSLSVSEEELTRVLRRLGFRNSQLRQLRTFLEAGRITRESGENFIPGLAARANQLMMDEPDRNRISPVTLDRRAAEQARERVTRLQEIGSREARALATRLNRSIGTVERPDLLAIVEEADRFLSAAESRDEAAELAALQRAREPAQRAAVSLRRLARDRRVGELAAAANRQADALEAELQRTPPRAAELARLTTAAQPTIARMEEAISAAEAQAAREAVLMQRRTAAERRISTIDELMGQDGITAGHRGNATTLLGRLRTAVRGTDAEALQTRITEADRLIALMRADIQRHAASTEEEKEPPPTAPTPGWRAPAGWGGHDWELTREDIDRLRASPMGRGMLSNILNRPFLSYSRRWSGTRGGRIRGLSFTVGDTSQEVLITLTQSDIEAVCGDLRIAFDADRELEILRANRTRIRDRVVRRYVQIATAYFRDRGVAPPTNLRALILGEVDTLITNALQAVEMPEVGIRSGQGGPRME